jgi:catechol 2,3-dioxygenase-like lactoylglutathione lyase family enzyme
MAMTSAPQVQRMDHFTIVSDRIQETRAFYAELGLQAGPRPSFSRDGLWLYVEGRPILHVIESDRMPEPRRGVLDHMAFFSHDVQRALDWVRGKRLPFRLQRAPEPFNIWQLFFPGPNGEDVELDFAPDEAPPKGWRGQTMTHETA